MAREKSLLTRAVELAKTGEFPNIEAVQERLHKEQFSRADRHIGGTMRRYIGAVCSQAYSGDG
jgi:hypothetical protein